MARGSRYNSDSSDDEEDVGDVILGFDDGPVPSTSANTVDATTSVLGGTPRFWPALASTPDKVVCRLCASLMALVCQLYIPQEGADERHRALYIFACVRKACQKEAGCVRAFSASRWDPQLAAETEAAKKAEERKRAAARKTERPVNPFSSNPFSSGFSAADNPFAASAFAPDPAPLSEPEADACLAEDMDALTISQDVPVEAWDPAHPRLPAYYIATGYEPASSGAPSSRASSAAPSIVEKDESGWKGEAYESMLETDRVFLNFQERIARGDCEGQVVRVGNTPLPFAPGATEPVELPCGSCGTARTFEAQIMPRAVDLLEKGLDQSKDEEMGWSTILIWTCPAVACADNSAQGSSWIEEGVRCQYET